MDDEYIGEIVNLNEKGYGFIKVAELDKNVFFHAKDLRHVSFPQLRKNDKVKISNVQQTEKGYNAKNVFLID